MSDAPRPEHSPKPDPREHSIERLLSPRLQLRWERADDPKWPWLCHYELVLPLRQFDIRREDAAGNAVRSEAVYSLGKTRMDGVRPVRDGKADPPFRDGAHARWDSLLLNVPVYCICDDVATLMPQSEP